MSSAATSAITPPMTHWRSRQQQRRGEHRRDPDEAGDRNRQEECGRWAQQEPLLVAVRRGLHASLAEFGTADQHSTDQRAGNERTSGRGRCAAGPADDG